MDTNKLIDELTKAVISQGTLALTSQIKIKGDGPIYDIHIRVYDSPVRKDIKNA